MERSRLNHRPMIRLNYLISSLNQVAAAKPRNGTAGCNYNCMDNLPLTAAGRMRFALGGLRFEFAFAPGFEPSSRPPGMPC